MKHLYFVRHGQSNDNANRVWSRQDAVLTELGRKQAQMAGEKARNEGLTFDIMVASPLPRTQDTACLIAAELGYPKEHIHLHPLFVERDWGELTGTSGESLLGKPYSRRGIDAIPSAEKLTALQERAAKALQYLSERPEETILLVGHGTFGRALRRVIADEPPEFEYNPEKFQYIPNAEIVKFI